LTLPGSTVTPHAIEFILNKIAKEMNEVKVASVHELFAAHELVDVISMTPKSISDPPDHISARD